ncbi:thioredoxin family protein [Persicirhabdus sediminis]|uniref:Thioredoxin family protein n=1 Tax=Persicirhabdus sediminis TaxID=454144 RepID=A0A8J7SL72_9BACT|nr:thioredoxin family protein [Persicirhabdus sediminis]MBK1791230.1 thioredoxin family protein [Persicirhabdus sediminis]
MSCGKHVPPTSPEEAMKNVPSTMIAGGGMGEQQMKVNVSQIIPAEKLIWAPEDENVPMDEQFEEVWATSNKDTWEVSYTVASRKAKQSGKPLMIWFTDSRNNGGNSPRCKVLSSELLETVEFEEWANEEAVRLRIDLYVRADPKDDLNEDDRVRNVKQGSVQERKQQYVDNLKRRYKVKGTPHIFMVSPSGKTVGNYKGFTTGGGPYLLGQLKQAARIIRDDYGAWREKMEKRGYRIWTNRSGDQVLAKLLRYSDGKVYLVDPDGRRSQTSVMRLSDADQAWIDAEKAKRGL